MHATDRTDVLLVRIALGAVWFTVALGIVMRLTLAGVVSLPLSFSFARHAHSHAGYFGVLFPLVWYAWREAGGAALSRAALLTYAGATAVVSIGFLFVGYQFVTIAASTVLGALWLWSAWRARALVRTTDAWLRGGPIGVALACAWVPPIGIMTPRDLALGNAIAHSFLAFLLFLVIIPAALSRARAPQLTPWLWLPLGAAAAVDLGAYPHPALGFAVALYGVMLLWVAPRAQGAWSARLALVVVGAGALLVGLRILPLTHATAMAAVHTAVLSAALGALAPLRTEVERVVLVFSGLSMGVAIALGDVGLSAAWTHGAAALFGAASLVPLARMRHPRAGH